MEVLNQVIPIYLVSLTIYPNVSIFLGVYPHLLDDHFNACNTKYNHNRMWQYDLALENYWVTESDYFRLAATMALCI